MCPNIDNFATSNGEFDVYCFRHEMDSKNRLRLSKNSDAAHKLIYIKFIKFSLAWDNAILDEIINASIGIKIFEWTNYN